jgi:hypothetical protein
MRKSMRSSIAGSIVALLAIGVIAGCGSSNAGGGTPTKAEYVARVNAACRNLNNRLKSVGENASSIRVKLDEANRVREKANAQLRAIPMPAQAKIPSEWLQLRDASLVAVKKLSKTKPRTQARDAAQAAYLKALEKGGAIAKSYGFVACSTGFAAS